MTESEWLAGDDTAAMLAWLTADDVTADAIDVRVGRACPSDRLLRLFAEAAGCAECARVCAGDAAVEYARYVCGGSCRSRDEKAALLREVFGNPFAPVTLPTARHCLACGRRPPDRWWNVCPYCQPALSGFTEERCPWLTDDVVSLAHAAYECRGTGGLLEADRLCVLADALEESGCGDQRLLDHLRGWETVPCASGGVVQAQVRVPLRGPHCLGCHALDLLLGRE